MGPRILVLDDDYVARKGIAELLKEFGYEALAFEKGEEAIEAVRDDEFDIALVDLKMPGMDGIEVLKAARAVKPGLYVVIITAFATIETAVEAMKLGAFDYIRKPFKADELRTIMKRIVDEKAFNRSLRDYEWMGPEKSPIEFFREEIETRKGMVVSKDKPDVLRRDFNLPKLPIYWLTSEEKGKGRVKPTDLNKIHKLVKDFTGRNSGSVVLFHGIEDLIEQNDWEKVSTFLQKVIKSTNDTESTLVISANPDNLEEHIRLELETMLSREYAQDMSESLSNPIRRAVLQLLSLSRRSSFTEILTNTKENDSSKLSFHIRKLCSAGAIAKDTKGKYFLTRRGENLIAVLRNLNVEGRKESSAFLMYEAEG